LKNKPPIPKADARKIVQERSLEITETELKKKSDLIINRLIDLDDFNYANKIFTYYSSSRTLVNTKPLIDFAAGCGKSVFLPKQNSGGSRLRRFQFSSFDDLIRSDNDFLEPKIGIEEDLSDIDLIIVPSIAVSLKGERTGYDLKYNPLLRNLFSPKYSLAFEFQLFHRLEYERQDIRIDRVITEQRTINTREF
jgi:5,10-methenyltetrahydrofolate synthetase